jgi:Flp pilus assembly protein TadD
MTHQPQKAVVVFEKAIKIAPNDQQVCFNYGISLAQLGQKAKADSMFTVAKNLAKK